MDTSTEEMKGIYTNKAGEPEKQHSLRIPMDIWCWIEMRRKISRRSANQEIVHLLSFARKVINDGDEKTAQDLIDRRLLDANV